MGEWDGERVPGASVRECGIVRVGEWERGRVGECESGVVRELERGAGGVGRMRLWESGRGSTIVNNSIFVAEDAKPL